MNKGAVYPVWADVRVSLEAVDWGEAYKGLLRAYRERDLKAQAHAWLWSSLRQSALFTWQNVGGPSLGDERFSGWCWCHSYAQGFQGGDEEGVRALVAELRSLWSWYDAARAHLEELEQRWVGSAEDEARVAQVVREAVEFVVGQGINDSWYSLIEPIVQWSFEVCGISLGEAEFERCVELPIERYFSSWVAPSREATLAFSEEVAFAAVLATFEQLYPGQETSDLE